MDENNQSKFFDRMREFFGDAVQPPGVSQRPSIIPNAGSTESSSLEDIERRKRALEEETKLFQIQAQLAGVQKEAIAAGNNEIQRRIKLLEGEAALLSRIKTPEAQDPRVPYPGAPQSKVIQSNTNQTAEQQAAEAGGEVPLTTGHHIKNYVHEILKHPSVGSVTAPLIKGYESLQSNGGIGAALSKGAVGLGAGIGAFEGLPYALGGLENFYGRTVGSDIAYGQAAGFSGNQGAQAFSTGLVNRYAVEPLNLLGSLSGVGQVPFFGSDAAKFGSERRLEAFKAGFNPFDALSIRDAESIQREVLNRGYRAGSDQENSVINSLERLKNTTGLDPGQALDYIDLFAKTLHMNVDNVRQDLESFAESARAAGKSVDEYTQEVSNVAKTLIQGNVDPNAARATAAGAASITGIDATTFQGVAGQGAANPFFIQQAMRQNPDIFNDPSKTLEFMANPSAALGIDTNATSVSSIKSVIDGLKQMYPDAPISRLANIATLYNIPGLEGMDARQIQLAYENGDSVVSETQRKGAFSELSDAYTQYDKLKNMPSKYTVKVGGQSRSVPDPAQVASQQRMGSQLDTLYDKYNKMIQNNPDLNPDEKDEIARMIRQHSNPTQIEGKVEQYLGQTRGDQASEDKKYMLEASPELKKFFRLVDQDPNFNRLKGEEARKAAERNAPRASDRTALENLLGTGG